MNYKINEPHSVIKDNIDTRWSNRTIYNHYDNPLDFMEDVINQKGKSAQADEYINQGNKLYEEINSKNTTYSTLYEDVAKKVKSKLMAKGFTTKMLYAPVEFTTENTGCMSKTRAMLGRRDCYFKDHKVTEGNLFHDIYINLSYSYEVSDYKIRENSYALYALTKELSRLIPIRVFVINHVGTDTPTCYSYCLKKFRQPINAHEFLFFTSDSKRTYGWATYDILSPGYSNSTVGSPKNTVSIANFNLDKEIKTIWEKIIASPKYKHLQ